MRKSMKHDVAETEGAATVAERPWYGPTRATMTLLGVAVAGFLVWLATQINGKTTGGYWAEYGIIAGAGVVLALSQLLGGWTKFGVPRLSASVFLFAFIPTLVVVGWIVILHQPHANWFRNHATTWSGDLGITSFVRDMGAMISATSLGLGVIFGYCLDTTGPRRMARTRHEQEVAAPAPAPAEDQAADAPLTAERAVATDAKLAATRARRVPEE